MTAFFSFAMTSAVSVTCMTLLVVAIGGIAECVVRVNLDVVCLRERVIRVGAVNCLSTGPSYG